MSGYGYDSSNRHSKNRLDPLEASLRCRLFPGNSQNRVVLIFSQPWSSHGLEVSATDDLRWATMKITIKVCRFRT